MMMEKEVGPRSTSTGMNNLPEDRIDARAPLNFEEDVGSQLSYDDFSSCSSLSYNFVKEPVPPEIYSSDSNLSLKLFFNDFERYFSYKYIGNDRDRCRILGTFLTGQPRNVFEVLGGTHLGYPTVKENMLTWYESERTIRIQKKINDFHNATIKVGENLTLFCLRVQVLAMQAYPKRPCEALKKLKKKVFSILPSSVVSSIEDREEMKKLIGLGKLTWSDVLEVVTNSDKKCGLAQFREGNIGTPKSNDKPLLNKDQEPPVENCLNVKGLEGQSSFKQFHTKSWHQNGNVKTGAQSSLKPRTSNKELIFKGKKIGMCFRCKLEGHQKSMCIAKIIFCSTCKVSHHRKVRCSSLVPSSLNRNFSLKGDPTSSIYSISNVAGFPTGDYSENGLCTPPNNPIGDRSYQNLIYSRSNFSCSVDKVHGDINIEGLGSGDSGVFSLCEP